MCTDALIHQRFADFVLVHRSSHKGNYSSSVPTTLPEKKVKTIIKNTNDESLSKWESNVPRQHSK